MCAKKEYGTDAYFQRQPRDHLYGQPPGHDFQSRQLIQGIPQGADHRRKSEPVLHQAHSLAMRCPGDDIPLLGSVHRGGQQSPYNFSETAQASNRVRMGQTLLSEPLVNFGGVASQDQKGFRRRSYGNVVDVTQKVFPDPSNDRDQGALPSVHGISNQSLGQLVVPAQRVASHAQQMETQVSRSFANFQRTSENAPTEEVIPLNRGAFIQDLEVRPGLPRYQNMQSMRQVRNDQTQSYPEGMEGPATTAYAYPQHQDFFPLPQQFRNDERDNALRIEEGRRQSFSETLGGNPEAEKCFPSTQGDVGGAHKSHLTLGRYVGQHGDNAARLRMDKSAAGPLKMESRGDIVQVGHLPHITDQVNSGHLDDSNRPSDDGRFAIENILMQHKNSGPSE